jgi:hypothetical protein
MIHRDEVDGLQYVLKASAVQSTPSVAQFMNIYIEGFQELTNVSHSRAHSTLIPLQSTTSDKQYALLYQVHVEHGRKIITLSAPLKVCFIPLI